MMKRLLLFVLASAVMVFATAPLTPAEPLIGVTLNNVLVSFDSATPGATSRITVTGLVAGDILTGIDYRPSNNLLYGIATAPGFTTTRLYTINPLTGAATFVAPLSTPANGEPGIDFNPVPDSQGLPSLRVVTLNEQNLRVNADTGATIVDAPINGVSVNQFAVIAGAAYTNNFFGAISTMLYGIDANSGQLIRFTDPNAGTVVDVGALGVNASGLIGFDISGLTGVAYAALSLPQMVSVFSSLYTINLATGQASLVGQIGTGEGPGALIRGLAALPGGGDPIPEPTTMLLLGTGLAGIAATVWRRNKNLQ